MLNPNPDASPICGRGSPPKPKDPSAPVKVEYPVYSTQVALGMSADANNVALTAEVSGTAKKKSHTWTMDENLVLLDGWIKFSIESIVGKKQKSEAYWGKIAQYCNEHCSFKSYVDSVSCRNRHNYIRSKLSEWVCAYDKAKRMMGGWSENDVLIKAHELYQNDNKGAFNLMEEWKAVRDEPRYARQLRDEPRYARQLNRGNKGSDSSGSKRAREDDVGDSSSIGSIPRPTGRDVSTGDLEGSSRNKDKVVRLTSINEKEEWDEFKQLIVRDLEAMEKLAIQQNQVVNVALEKTRAINRKMWLKLSEKNHLSEHQQMLFNQLTAELFPN